ncbi:hypothetical protein BASA62_004296 [Batrachochytrium salamandrivorans]|nr:hypothetical protein BASA62_004296 [Batrachochytrium salamandrivorans]
MTSAAQDAIARPALSRCLNNAAILSGSSHAMLPSVPTSVKPASFTEILLVRLDQIESYGPVVQQNMQHDNLSTTSLAHSISPSPGVEPATTIASAVDHVKTRYVRACLSCLESIWHALGADPSLSVDGVKDRASIETLVPIIICWGMAPSLDPFASKKIQQRFKLPKDASITNAGAPKAPLEKTLFGECLTTIMRILLSDYTCYPVDLLRRRYLAAGLLCAIAVQTGTTIDAQKVDSESTNGHVSERLSAIVIDEKPCLGVAESKGLIQDCFLKLGTRLCMDVLLSLLTRLSPGPPCPSWLASTVGSYLSTLILSPGGVQSLLSLLLPVNSSDGEIVSVSITQLEQVSKLLLTPSTGISKHSYFVNLSSQLQSISENDTIVSKSAVLAANFTISQFVSKHPKLGKKYFIDPMMEPIMRFYLIGSQRDIKVGIISTDVQITATVDSLAQLIAGNEPSQSLMQSISAAIPVMYYMLEKAVRSKLALRTSLTQIIDTYFKLSDTVDVVQTLYAICIGQSEQEFAMMACSDNGAIEFVAPGSGDFVCETDGSLLVDSMEFCKYVQELERPTVIGELFIRILEGSLLAKRVHEDSDKDPVSDINIGLTSVISNQELINMRHAAMVIAMMNQFGDTLLQNTNQILKFIKTTLIESELDSISLALTLLKEIFSNDVLNLDAEGKHTAVEIKIILHTLTLHENETVRAMSQGARIAIMAQTGTPLSATAEHDTLAHKQNTDFRNALKELGDPLLPLRAHGMSVLRRLVLESAPVARENLDSVITIFLDMVEDPDSFIYLNAIKGLSALTDKHASETLARISQRYTDKTGIDMDYRLRIGEVLMQTIQRCGQVFPKHATEVLPGLLLVMRDTEKEMRSSALSLLSRVAEVAPLSLLPLIEQISDYIVTALQLEPEAEARRGSVVVIISLIRALGHKAIQMLPMRIIQRLRRQLEISSHSERDELTRHHAQLALEDITTILSIS